MQPPPVPEDAIRQLLDEQIAAWNAGDAEGWCKDFTEDSEFVNIIGARFEDRDANVRRHAELFATIFKGSRLAMREVRIRVLGSSAAFADLVLDLTGFSRLPPGIRPSIGNDVLRTRMHYVLIHDGTRWWIVFSQNNAVMPLPPQE
ncbi:MAG TPA: SgcJ/EcaC family oxidoreductase [Rhodanobacteraceae bacterium]|nr:SgcJ/EcaC family oxidoreductase [Rhodanobacteraceae bacterium]